MTFWKALGIAALAIGGFVAFIRLFFWTMESWFDGEWWERVISLFIWAVLLALVILAFSQVAAPA